jgi:hypothetical protein
LPQTSVFQKHLGICFVLYRRVLDSSIQILTLAETQLKRRSDLEERRILSSIDLLKNIKIASPLDDH